MARSKDEIEKLKLKALKEQSEEYEKHRAELDRLFKEKVKQGKALQGQTKEERIEKEKMMALEKQHLEYLKATNKEEYEKEKNRRYESEAYLDERIKQIDDTIDRESQFFSLSKRLSGDAYEAYKKGDMERFKLSNDLTDKAIEQAQNEELIGTEKFQTIDHSARINELAKEEIVLTRDLAIARATGNKDLEKEIIKKIENNKHEKTTLETLQSSGEAANRRHEIITAGLKPLQDMKDKIEGFANVVEGLVANPMVMFVALAAALVKHFTATEQAMEDFRKNMGLSQSEAKKLEKNALQVSKNMASSGVSLTDALGATESLVNEFGDMNVANERNVETVLRMNKALGMSNDEAAKFLSSMQAMTGSTIEQAEALAAGATNMARAAGVAPAKVIADMSASADSFAAYMKDGGKNLAEAAVFAAKAGLEVSTMVAMADNLLDIEGSIEKQMEAQVLIGKNINLEKARQAAIDGDMVTMSEEILKNVGSQAEFEEMNAIQRKALAEAMGLSVGELGKMISKQETLQKLADGTLSTQEALAELPLSEVMDAKGITGPITDIKNSISAIAMNLLEVFRPVFSAIAFVLKPIAYTLGLVAKLLNNPIGKGIVLFYTYNKLINSEIIKGMALKTKDFAKDMMRGKLKLGLLSKMKGAGGEGGITGKIKGMFSSKQESPSTDVQSKGAGGMMKSIGKIDMNKVLKGAAAMIVVAGALAIFAESLKRLPTEPGPYIGAAVGLGMLMGAVFLMGKMQGNLLKGSVAMLLMGAAFLPFAFGLSLLTDLDFGAIIAAAGALLIFTAAIFGLGALMTSGVGAVLFGAGIVAFAALGATMIIFGAGLMVVATAASLLSESMSGVATGLTELVASSDGIFSLALGLGALALGFISLAGSLAILMPFLPLLLVLGASGVIGQVLGTAEPGEPAEGGGEKKESQASKDRQRTIMLLEQILERVSQGGEVNMDGKKVGEIIAGGATIGPLVG